MTLMLWRPWLFGMLLVCGAVIGGLVLHGVVFGVFDYFRKRKPVSAPTYAWVQTVRHPILYLLLTFLLGLVAKARPLPIPDRLHDLAAHALLIVFIGCTAWLLIKVFEVISNLLIGRYEIKVADNLAARRIRTQMVVISRAADGFVLLLALALVLMTFPGVWSLGAGLFASAGVAGIIIGTAAQPVLKNLLAGLQIALAQPIRIDDVVIVQGEWGRIEEITSTYVVVRIWDLRRMVVPLSYFIEQPFQNWTRQTSDLLGTIMLYVDVTAVIEDLRQEARRVVESSPLWNKAVFAVQVTDMTAQNLEVRVLVSASDSSKLFDLRCFVREKLTAYVAGQKMRAVTAIEHRAVSALASPSA